MMTATLTTVPQVRLAQPDAYLAGELQRAGRVLMAGTVSTAAGLLVLTVAPCVAAVTLGTLALFAVLGVPAFRR